MSESERKLSPDGTYVVLRVPIEMRMSHWLECPIVIETASNAILLDLGKSM